MSDLNKDDFQDTSYTGPRATPTIPDGGNLSAFSTFTTSVPPSTVRDTILDYQSWPEWNSFVPLCTVTHPSPPPTRLETGCKMTFKARMTPAITAPSKEIVTQVDPAPTKPGEVCRICWVYDNMGLMTPGFVLRAERVNEIELREDGGTDYRTWETFSGPAAHVVKWKFGESLRERFQDWSRDLKAYVEAQSAAAGDEPETRDDTIA